MLFAVHRDVHVDGGASYSRWYRRHLQCPTPIDDVIKSTARQQNIDIGDERIKWGNENPLLDIGSAADGPIGVKDRVG